MNCQYKLTLVLRSPGKCFYILLDGQWKKNCILMTNRAYHSTWHSSRGILLMGSSSGTDNWENSTELIKPGENRTLASFGLKYRAEYVSFIETLQNSSHFATSYACSISLRASVIVTGGVDTVSGWTGGTSKRVTQYGEHGWLADLPMMSTGHKDHACAAYFKPDGTRVLLVTG